MSIANASVRVAFLNSSTSPSDTMSNRGPPRSRRGPPSGGRRDGDRTDERPSGRSRRLTDQSVDDMLDSWQEEEVDEEWHEVDEDSSAAGSGFAVHRPEIAGGTITRALRPGEARPKRSEGADGSEWKNYFDQFSDDIEERKGQVGRDAKLGATVVLGRWAAIMHGTTAVALALPGLLIAAALVLFTGLLGSTPADLASIVTQWALSALALLSVIAGLSFGLAHAVGRAVTGLGQLSREAPTMGVSAKFALVPTVGLAAPAALSTLLMTVGLHFHGTSMSNFDLDRIQTGEALHGTFAIIVGVFGLLMSIVGAVPLLVRDILLAEE